MLDYYRKLLAVRRREIVPRIPHLGAGRCTPFGNDRVFAVAWNCKDGSVLQVHANLTERTVPDVCPPTGRVIFATHDVGSASVNKELQPWSVTWFAREQR